MWARCGNERKTKQWDSVNIIIQIKRKWNSVYCFAKRIIIIMVTLIWFHFKSTISKILTFSFSKVCPIFNNTAHTQSVFQIRNKRMNAQKKSHFNRRSFPVPSYIILYCFSNVSQYVYSN